MINISVNSIELLRDCLKSNNSELLWVLEDSGIVKVDELLGNELREAVCDELMKNGLDKDKPSEYGRELEKLIDEIGRLFI